MLECELGPRPGFIALPNCSRDAHCGQERDRGGSVRQLGGSSGDGVDIKSTGGQHLTNGAGGAGRAAGGILRQLGKHQ